MISRNEAIKVLSRRDFHCRSCANSLVGDCGDCILDSALGMAVQALEENEFLEDLKGGCAGCRIITKLDRERRPQGEWINPYLSSATGEFSAKCNICNEDIIVSSSHHNFCPNCGADMRGEEDGSMGF